MDQRSQQHLLHVLHPHLCLHARSYRSTIHAVSQRSKAAQQTIVTYPLTIVDTGAPSAKASPCSLQAACPEQVSMRVQPETSQLPTPTAQRRPASCTSSHSSSARPGLPFRGCTRRRFSRWRFVQRATLLVLLDGVSIDLSLLPFEMIC